MIEGVEYLLKSPVQSTNGQAAREERKSHPVCFCLCIAPGDGILDLNQTKGGITMSKMPLIAKHVNPKITRKQIKAAITEFRQQFPDDPRLAKVSDVEIQRRVEKFLKSKRVFAPKLTSPPVRKLGVEEIIAPCPLAIGVVIVDVIFMIIGFVGLHATYSEAVKRAAVKEVGKEVAKSLPGWLKLINALKNARSATAKAKAVFKIGSAAYTAGMFRGILASIKSSMKWWDWVITGVAAVSQIAALFLTDGAAFIAEILLNAAAVAYVVSDSVKAVQACGG
jgi:hypothetical protein